MSEENPIQQTGQSGGETQQAGSVFLIGSILNQLIGGTGTSVQGTGIGGGTGTETGTGTFTLPPPPESCIPERTKAVNSYSTFKSELDMYIGQIKALNTTKDQWLTARGQELSLQSRGKDISSQITKAQTEASSLRNKATAHDSKASQFLNARNVSGHDREKAAADTNRLQAGAYDQVANGLQTLLDKANQEILNKQKEEDALDAQITAQSQSAASMWPRVTAANDVYYKDLQAYKKCLASTGQQYSGDPPDTQSSLNQLQINASAKG